MVGLSFTQPTPNTSIHEKAEDIQKTLFWESRGIPTPTIKEAHTPRFINDVRHLLPYMRTASRAATTYKKSQSVAANSTNHQYFHNHLHAKNCRRFGETRSSSHFSDSDPGFYSDPGLHSTESRPELEPTQTISTSLEHETPPGHTLLPPNHPILAAACCHRR